MDNSSGKIILYEGKKGKMSRSNQKKRNHGVQNSGTGNNPRNNNSGNSEKSLPDIIKTASLIMGILISIVTATVYVVTNNVNHQKDIEILQANIGEIKDDISDINSNYNDIQSYMDGLSSMFQKDHEFVLQQSSRDTEESAYKVTLNEDNLINMEVVKGVEYLAAPPWNEGDSAIASNGDIIYGVQELYNIPFITSYLDGNNEVYFWGRFNENNQWNGKCILNIYNGNKLVSIFEGNYKDGTLYSYQSVKSKEDIWIVNNRTHHEDYNSGETWTYSKNDDFVKEFTMDDVKEKQILTVDKFLKSKGVELLSYYKGRTSNGLFNDDTGRAFFVSYFKGGAIGGTSKERIIKTLYQGCFLDGYFYDESDDAWYITREPDTTYMYYEGSFSDGTADNKKVTDFQNGIGCEFISQKLKEKGFEDYELDFWTEYDDSIEKIN